MTSPYKKGPIKRGEIPKMGLGIAIIGLGTWGLVRMLLAKKNAVQANALALPHAWVAREPRGDR